MTISIPTVSDLASLDRDLYRNLMFLKNYEGDLLDLGINFSVTDNLLGQQKVIPLLQNGENIPVDKQNRQILTNIC